jgi:hypothetical protein
MPALAGIFFGAIAYGKASIKRKSIAAHPLPLAGLGLALKINSFNFNALLPCWSVGTGVALVRVTVKKWLINLPLRAIHRGANHVYLL